LIVVMLVEHGADATTIGAGRAITAPRAERRSTRIRNVRLTRHILIVSTACRISETKMMTSMCQFVRNGVCGFSSQKQRSAK
jgi:hypothetical protein